MKMLNVFWRTSFIMTLAFIIHCEVTESLSLTRHCQNRCRDKSNIFCGMSPHRCNELSVRLICPRTCKTCECDLVTCEDGTCVDVLEPSVCTEFKTARKCALTRQLDSMGSCSRTCGDCIPCKLPCTPDCRDYGIPVKCRYFVKAGFCTAFPDAKILCPKSCGVCRTCPKTLEDILSMTITSTTEQLKTTTTTTAETAAVLSKNLKDIDYDRYY